MFLLAERNGIAIPYASVEHVRAAYDFSNLQDFLDIYYAGAGVLQTEDDFYDLPMAYFARAAADGVLHAEIMFDPQTHTDRGIAFGVVIEGLLAAMEAAEKKHGMTSTLIMSFLRHLPEQAAFDTLAMAEPWLDRIVAVGLDSSEVGHPPVKFARVFAAAREKGLKLVAHAGEEGPPKYVREALDILKVDRIDHGNRALEDSGLVQRLAQDNMTLTVCPLSNLKLCVVQDFANHPIDKMLRLGLKATINSDDPAYFGGYIAENYRAVASARGLGREDMAQLACNSFMGSFLPAEAVQRHISTIKAFVDAEA